MDLIPSAFINFFTKLNSCDIRYCAFKSTNNLLYGLQGSQDIDILICRADYCKFVEIASSFNGKNFVTVRELSSSGRTDWFIPDFETSTYLHLDIHTEILLGPKFSKQVKCLRYEDIVEIDLFENLIPIPSPKYELALLLNRLSFRKFSLVNRQLNLSGDWLVEANYLLNCLGATSSEYYLFEHPLYSKIIPFSIQYSGKKIAINFSDLHSLRSHYYSVNLFNSFDEYLLLIRGFLIRYTYKFNRLLNKILPGLSLDRRRPSNGGLVIALIAPDGLGKTTQVNLLTKIFSFKFSCFNLYLGNGSGQGGFLRQRIRNSYLSSSFYQSKHNYSIRSSDDTKSSMVSYLKNYLFYGLKAFAACLFAFEKYLTIKRAFSSAAKGYIVLCDRWPQILQDGILDGRIYIPAKYNKGIVRIFKWIESLLFFYFSKLSPDLLIFLEADYSVSESRKPGEISRQAFLDRIKVIELMKNSKKFQYSSIDASSDVKTVVSQIFFRIWQIL